MFCRSDFYLVKVWLDFSNVRQVNVSWFFKITWAAEQSISVMLCSSAHCLIEHQLTATRLVLILDSIFIQKFCSLLPKKSWNRIYLPFFSLLISSFRHEIGMFFRQFVKNRGKNIQRKQCLEDESMWAINYRVFSVFFTKKISEQFGIPDDMMTFTKENIHFFPWWK